MIIFKKYIPLIPLDVTVVAVLKMTVVDLDSLVVHRIVAVPVKKKFEIADRNVNDDYIQQDPLPISEVKTFKLIYWKPIFSSFREINDFYKT